MDRKSKSYGAYSVADAKLRGVLAKSRGRRFGVDVRTKAFQYRQGSQHALLLLRLSGRSESVDRFLSRRKKLSEFEANRYSRQPIGFDYLSLLTLTKPLPLHEEIDWLSRRLAHFSSGISAFVERRNRVDGFIVNSDFQRAMEEIEMLDAEAGISLWSVSITVALLQIFVGTEAQKLFVGRIKSGNKSGFLPYLANYTSQLAEETVSIGWYRQSLNRRLTSREVGDITTYMEAKLSAVWPESEEGIATCLRVEQNHHEFDIFDSAVDAFLNLTARPSVSSRSIEAVRNFVAQLGTVGDHRIEKLAASLGVASVPSEARYSEPDSIGRIFSGEIAVARHLASHELDKDRGNKYSVIALSLASTFFRRNRANAKWGVIINSVITGLGALFLRRSKLADGRSDELEKLCVMLKGLPYFDGLLELIRAERRPELGSYIQALASAAMRWKGYGPFDLSSLPAASVDDVLDRKMLPRFGTFLSQMSGRQTAESDSLCENANAFAKVFCRVLSGSGEDAGRIESLLQSRSRWIGSRAANLSLHAYATEGDVGKASDIISWECCVHRTASELLPVRQVFESLEWKALSPYATSIGFVNAYSIYAEIAADDKAGTYRRFAVETFLRARGVGVPSELRSQSDSFNLSELCFFLGVVCAVPQIDMLRPLKGSAKVLEERRAICSLVINLDKEKASDYEVEVLTISKDIAVQHGLLAFDGSRVHVDRAGLKKVLKSQLAESYARYAALVSSGIGIAEDFDSVFRDLMRNDGSAKYLLTIPENEADELLAGMMREIRTKFLLDIPHGLDSYLSKRVRHGSIVGYIRGALEQEGIVLRRDFSGRYQPDGKLVSGLSPSEQDLLGQAQVDISALVDSHLIRLKDVLLHVRTPEYPLGVFDIGYSPAAVHFVRSALKTDQSLDGLLDSVIAVLWGVMAPSLNAARTLLTVDANKFVTDQLELLRFRAANIVSDNAERVRITGSIGRAITAVQGRLAAAGGWFDAVVVEAREYTLAEAIEIGLASVKAIHYGFEPSIEIVSTSKKVMNSTHLPIFVDIMYIIFSNVAQYAGCGSRPPCRVSVEECHGGEGLQVRVENEVCLDLPFAECVKAMSSRKRRIEEGHFVAAIREEGGSGLPKLASIASQSSRGRLDFGYRDESTFFVEVELSLVTEEA